MYNYVIIGTQNKNRLLYIAAITFWSQFAVYTFNAVLILYLTKPIIEYGLGFSQANAYAFQGVSKNFLDVGLIGVALGIISMIVAIFIVRYLRHKKIQVA